MDTDQLMVEFLKRKRESPSNPGAKRSLGMKTTLIWKKMVSRTQ